jgi:hypothetical protein
MGPPQLPSERTPRGEALVEDGLEQRPESPDIRGRDQVERPPHEVDPNGPPVPDQAGQFRHTAVRKESRRVSQVRFLRGQRTRPATIRRRGLAPRPRPL